MHIRDHVFIVTGAASGLGAATAQRLAAQGGQVLAADLKPGAAAAGIRTIAADVTQASDARAVVDCAIAEFGGVHGLVNCAGIAPAEKVLGRNGVHALESFARVIGVNLIGTFNMLRLAAEAMARNAPGADGERGIIINTASVAAFEGQVGQAAYSASKAGVAGMTLPLARELARQGIRVMTIAPGVFETPMMLGMPDEVRESLNALVPFPSRLGHPDEYAALAQHIIENVMLNGEVIRLDGALRMPK